LSTRAKKSLKPGMLVRIKPSEKIRQTLKDPETISFSTHKKDNLAYFIILGMEKYCNKKVVVERETTPHQWKLRGIGLSFHEDWLEVAEED